MQAEGNGRKIKTEQEFPEGKIQYKMTNDFMFKTVFQQNMKALKGLLCALLDMKLEEIRTVRVLKNSIQIITFIIIIPDISIVTKCQSMCYN